MMPSQPSVEAGTFPFKRPSFADWRWQAVALVPDDDLFDKNLSTLGEIRARRGPVLAVGHTELDPKLADHQVRLPKNEPELDPILLSVPLQMLAYHAAVVLGNDVDKPRNLAKSVTVE